MWLGVFLKVLAIPHLLQDAPRAQGIPRDRCLRCKASWEEEGHDISSLSGPQIAQAPACLPWPALPPKKVLPRPTGWFPEKAHNRPTMGQPSILDWPQGRKEQAGSPSLQGVLLVGLTWLRQKSLPGVVPESDTESRGHWEAVF